jgi:hypothetical protein
VAERISEYLKRCLTYIFKFIVHALSSVVYFAVCALSAKAICLIRRALIFEAEGHVTVLAFKFLEWYFLFVGLLIAAVYFAIDAKGLFQEFRDERAKLRSKTGV